jgi:hypothetical protein
MTPFSRRTPTLAESPTRDVDDVVRTLAGPAADRLPRPGSTSTARFGFLGPVMKVRHDTPRRRAYGSPAMRNQPSASESARALAIIRPPEPTTRHLAVLDAYAETGTYELTGAATGIRAATVRNLLIEIRGHYGAATTIQAYRAALVAGDLPAPDGDDPAVRS